MFPLLRRAVLVSLSLAFTILVPVARGQGFPGSITGHVTDGGTKGVAGASIQLVGTPYWARTRDDGSFRLDNVAPGSHLVRARLLGYSSDSARVTVTSGAAVEATLALHPAAVSLENVLVVAHRMGETKAAALDRQNEAVNLVTVLSGDEIRALPNYNAAEAAGRMPDVSLERDEGEGKFVQIRGTEPRLSNVTIDGVHVPGTERGDRIVKLDDVPSDVLGAIEVSKTLTADMDADAIGGSINLVTKTPQGRPQGYIAAQYGHISLLNHDLGQGGLTYGGRFGPDQKLGFLIGGSVDRTNRVINDVEPAWNVDTTGRSYPIEWSVRDYDYYRSRFGGGLDLDYRFSDHSSVYLKGLWSMFKNHGTRYVYDLAATTDSAVVGATGIDTGTTLTREVSVRTPTEQLWGFTAGGRQETGRWMIDYAASWAGTRQSVDDYRFSPFVYSGGTPIEARYDASNTELPTFTYLNSAQAALAVNPDSFTLADYDASNHLTTGRSLGGQFNAQLAYDLGRRASWFKFGARVRDERKVNTQGNVLFNYSGATPYRLSQALSSFADASYYQDLASGFSMGPLPDLNTVNPFENTHPTSFTNASNNVRNQLGSFSGTERIYAGYAMNTVEFGDLQVNVGLRVETTHSEYTGHVAAKESVTGATTVSEASGSNNYTDVFPSIQLRYAVDANSNVRVAVTRGIARPNYSDLAPSVQGSLGSTNQRNYSNLSAGNPDLKAQHSWNYDLLVERFLPQFGGVVSAGVFYKALTDVILSRNFIYDGPYTPFVGYYGTEPQNGGSGHIVGIEAQWAQHLTFLTGALSGLGFDVNWMHADSKVLVDPVSGREAPLLRQAPDIANAALLYDRGQVSGRLAWTYNGPYIASYGDGTATAGGDTYFYQHSQIDASVIYSLTPTVQIQAQALSLNNAQFGFFQGTTDRRYDIQREYYGRTFYLGAKYGF